VTGQPVTASSGAVRISVIMINRNGASTLSTALSTLVQSMENCLNCQATELLVVDNGSTDDSCRVIEQTLRNHAVAWKLIVEQRPGVNHARNRGIAESSGDILIFVDSDVTFSPHWLESYCKAFKTYLDVDVFGGRVVPDIPDSPPEWFALHGPYARPSITITVDLGDSNLVRPLSSSEGPVGPNMAFRRAVFERFGDFDTDFGLRPGSLVAGAEYEIFDRLAGSNLAFAYVAGASVLHPIRTDQLSKVYFLRRLHGTGRVMSRVRHKRGLEARRFMGLTLFVVRNLLESAWSYIRSVAHREPKERFYYLCELSIQSGHLTEDFHAWRTRRTSAR